MLEVLVIVVIVTRLLLLVCVIGSYYIDVCYFLFLLLISWRKEKKQNQVFHGSPLWKFFYSHLRGEAEFYDIYKSVQQVTFRYLIGECKLCKVWQLRRFCERSELYPNNHLWTFLTKQMPNYLYLWQQCYWAPWLWCNLN